jgi:hypothetical protein
LANKKLWTNIWKIPNSRFSKFLDHNFSLR